MVCQKCRAELPENSEFCLKCGAKVASQPTVQSDSASPVSPIEMGESTSSNPKESLVGIGGWLAFFLLTMMLFGPLMDILYFGEHPNELHNPFTWLVILTVHGLGYYAGILMLRGKAKGIRWAKIRLMVGAGVGALGIVGTIAGGVADPHATTTSSDLMSSLRAIGYSAIWLAYLGESKRVKNTYFHVAAPSEPAKENAQIPTDTATTPSTEQRVRVGPIIRDVALVWLLTAMGGFVAGIASSKASRAAQESIMAQAVSNFLFGTVAFTIAGCLAPRPRWRHLAFVAVGAWFASLINVVFFGVSIPEWIAGAVVMALIMGLGGAISHVLKKEAKQSVPG
jgi:hypothetical protein